MAQDSQAIVQQIIDLIGQLSPEDVQALMAQLEAQKPETEDEGSAMGGMMNPNAGPGGVPAQ